MGLVVVLAGGVLLANRKAKAVTHSAAGTRSTRHFAPQSPPEAREAGCSLLFAVAWIAFSVLVVLVALGVISSQWWVDTPGRSLPAMLFPACFALVGVLFGIVGVWILVQSGRTISLAWSLARQGRMVQATIIDRWIDRDTGGDTSYCVAYRFSVPDGPVIEASEYNHAAYNHYTINDQVAVQYLPGQPKICRLVMIPAGTQ